jgi:hypothetical protein
MEKSGIRKEGIRIRWLDEEYGSEPDARLLRRKGRDASRGSPRSFSRKSSGFRMTTLFSLRLLFLAPSLLAPRAVVAAAARDYDSLDGTLAD